MEKRKLLRKGVFHFAPGSESSLDIVDCNFNTRDSPTGKGIFMGCLLLKAAFSSEAGRKTKFLFQVAEMER